MGKRSFFNRQTPAVALLCNPEGLNQAIALAMSASMRSVSFTGRR